jgi:CBS domain-containing protein
MTMKVREVMTSDVITVDKDQNLQEVLNLMEGHRITKIPVVDDKKLVGVVTDGNIADKLGRAHNRGVQTTTLHASSVMTRDFVVAHPDEDLRNMLVDVGKPGLTMIPVVRGHELVGIVTKADLLPLVESNQELAAIMKRELKAVGPTERIVHARRLLLDHDIARLPVLEGGRIRGIIAEHEIARAFANLKNAEVGVQRNSVRDLQVGDHMVQDVITAPPTATARQAAELMIRHQVGALPIVNGGKVIEGIVTRTDLIRTFAS